jgi:raffinose/stachyose/melibiose transport system permease protein
VLFLLANMLPQEAMIYPLYYMFKQVGLYDNVWAVIIILTVVESAFGTYLLSSVFSTFPAAVLEAAALDGASRWQILTRIIIPISRPTLAVLLVFFFIWSWNEFLIPLVFLVSNDNQTVPLAVATLTGEKVQDVTTTSASALLGLLPTLIFFLIFQRTLTKGITAGAVK